MRVLAIDPGAKGAFCLHGDTGIESVSKMPAGETEIARLLTTYVKQADRCVIEAIGMRPGEGQRSTATFYQSYGFLRGVLVALQAPLETVRPQAWQVGLGLPNRTPPKGTDKKTRAAAKREHKRDLAELARQRFPNFEGITLLTCDAMLMAQWGWLRWSAQR